MTIAESYYNYLGEEKKAYVLTKLNQYALDNGITFDEEKASQKIEELIALSKNVNYQNTTKSEFSTLLGKKDQ
jgi:hypothetical protein